MSYKPPRFVFPDSVDARGGRYGSRDFIYYVEEARLTGGPIAKIYKMSPSAIFHTWLPAYRDWKEKQKDDSGYTTGDTAPLVD